MKRTLLGIFATAICGAATLFVFAAAIAQSSRDQTERNKETVIKFYNAALNDKQPDEALEYVGPYYKQHNPMAEDGREGFHKFIDWFGRTIRNHTAKSNKFLRMEIMFS
jgi:hypothetical protein